MRRAAASGSRPPDSSASSLEPTGATRSFCSGWAEARSAAVSPVRSTTTLATSMSKMPLPWRITSASPTSTRALKA